MRNLHVPQTRVPGAHPRISPETLMAMFDKDGKMLWDMPPPSSYVEHKVRRRHKRTGKRIEDMAMVPVYRGTSASFARYTKSQIRRAQRKAAEAQALVDELNAAEENAKQEAEASLQDLVLNPGNYDAQDNV